jgi:hypothetical protein
MKKLFYAASVLMLSSTIFIACKGDQGDVGPAGAAGTTGPAGPIGPTGPQGNANVVVDTFTISNSNWAWNSSYTFTTATGASTSWFTRFYERNYTGITQAILDKGVVLVYFTSNASNSNQWTPLNFSYLAFGSQFHYNLVYETLLGKVRLHYFFTPNGASGTTPGNLSTFAIPNYKFKIIAIAGAIGGRFTSGPAAGYTIEMLKSLPYETVCQILNIKP